MTDEKTQSTNIVSADTKYKYKILRQILIFSGAVALIAIGSVVQDALSAFIVGVFILFFGDWN